MNRRIRTLLVVFLAFAIFACQGLGAPTGKEAYLVSRKEAFETKADKFASLVEMNGNTPYGVILDDQLSNDLITTTFAYISGDAGLLTISGHGRVDGIKYETVSNAAKKSVSLASNYLDKMSLATDYSLPTLYHVNIYVLTPQGIYTTGEINEGDLQSGENAFSRLYDAQENIITAFSELPGQ